MNSIILKEVGRAVIPFIQVFGMYVIFHGHLSPGGGFAGGTIIGASLILFRIIHKEGAKKMLTYKYLISCSSFALILYGLMKGYSFITGGSKLHLPQLPLGTPGNILSGGFLLPLNILVGVIVAITIYFFYSLFDEGEI